jgi:hypothetical protein
MPNRAEILKQQFMQSLGQPWQKLLPESRLDEILKEEKLSYRNSVYTPIVTLWAMVSQVFDPDKSLNNAVKRIISWFAAAGAECPSKWMTINNYTAFNGGYLPLALGSF